MSPRAWMWYWRGGWVFGPVLLWEGVVDGSALLVGLGLVVLLLALVLPRWYRGRIPE